MAEPTATFTMTQLAAAYRRYQRSTFSGGDFGKGAGAIDVTIGSATAGTFHARLSSGGATRGDIKPAWAAGSVAGGATTLIATGVPAMDPDFYLDLGISDGAGGTTWLNGTTPVAMGAVINWIGQSLQLDAMAKVHDTSGTIAATGAAINTRGRVRFQLPGDPATGWVLPTDAPNGARVINSAGVAEHLDLVARKLGIAVGVIGYAQGSTSITNWIPGGSNHATLVNNLALGGGAFEECRIYLGHTDAANVMAYHVMYGHLTTFFADMATRSSVPFRKVLSAIPNVNSASWGDFKARANIRTAMERWAQDNGGIYVTMSDIDMNADMVHPVQAGARRTEQHFYRAIYTPTGDVGPQLVSVVKSGVNLLCTVSLPAGATSLVSVGTPEVRMLVTGAANTAGAALALDAVNPFTLTGPTTFTLKLATDPGDVPLEVWPMGAHPVADGSASGLFDDSNDGDGIARGRQLRFPSVPALRKATGTLTGVGATYIATPLGSGRSGGYLTSAGPLLPAVPYAGRTIEFKLRYDATAAVWRTVLGQSGVLIVKLNTTNQLVIQYDSANSFSYTHGWAADGAWHHICIVQEPGNQRRHLVIDGALVQTQTGNGASYIVTNPFRIGANQSGSEILTTGVVDEVAIWNRAKSLTEMLVVPAAPYTGNEPGLQYLWHLDGDGSDSASSTALNSLYVASRSQISLAVAALFDGADAGGATTSDAAMSEVGAATANIAGAALINTTLAGGGVGSLTGAGLTLSGAVLSAAGSASLTSSGAAVVGTSLSGSGTGALSGASAATVETALNVAVGGSLSAFSGGNTSMSLSGVASSALQAVGSSVIDTVMLAGAGGVAALTATPVIGAQLNATASSGLSGVGTAVRSGDVVVMISSTLAAESAVTVGAALIAAGSGGETFVAQVYQSTALVVSGQGAMAASSVETTVSNVGDRVVRIGPQSRIIYIGATT